MADREFLTFQLEIGPGSQGEYPLLVRRSPAGEGEGKLRLPFNDLALEGYRQELRIALARSGRRRAGPTEQELSVQDFGARLFEALFSGQVLRLYDASRQQAAAQGKGLALALTIEPPELAALAWEFLYDPRSNEYLCLSPQVSLLRSIASAQDDQPSRVTLPLRILGLVSAPDDQPALAVEREKQRLEAALGPLLTRGLVELEWVAGQSWPDLQRAVWLGGWHVFYFIGHGGLEADTGRGYVILASDAGESRPLSASRLARLLGRCQELRLAVLSAGQGVQVQFSTMATALVQQGLPAVLALDYGPTERAAVSWNESFFRSLVAARSLAQAVAEGRMAVRSKAPHSLEWGVLRLYTLEPAFRPLDTQAHVALAMRLGQEALAEDDFEGAVTRFALAVAMGAGDEAREKQVLADKVRGGLLTARQALKALSGASEDQAEAILQVSGRLEALQQRLPESRAIQIELARARERALLLRDRLWSQAQELIRGRAVGLTLSQRQKRVKEAVRLLEKAETLDWTREAELGEDLVHARRRLDYLQKAQIKNQAARRRRLLILGLVGAAIAAVLLALCLATDLLPLSMLGLGDRGTGGPPLTATAFATQGAVVALSTTRPASTPLPTATQAATRLPTQAATATVPGLGGATAVPTESSTSLSGAGATATPQPSPTGVPAETPTPRPTATLPPVATARSTASGPTSTPSATSAPTATPTPGIIYPAPVLIEPEDVSLLTQSTFSTYLFEWTWEGTLESDEWFDVRVWQPGMPHYGVAWTRERAYLYDLCLQGSGEYLWSVAVVRGQEGQWLGDLSPEARPHRFTSSRSDVWCDRHGRFSLPAPGGPQ